MIKVEEVIYDKVLITCYSIDNDNILTIIDDDNNNRSSSYFFIRGMYSMHRSFFRDVFPVL